jgi:hypothetical protein
MKRRVLRRPLSGRAGRCLSFGRRVNVNFAVLGIPRWDDFRTDGSTLSTMQMRVEP